MHVLGQLIVPSSHALLLGPLRLICPVLLAGAQMSWLEQERSPAWHHADPGQLVLGGLGTSVQGEANQVRLLGGSAGGLAGFDPNWHGLAQFPPPPTAQVPDEKPAVFTNSMVTSRARRVLPPRQMPPPPGKPRASNAR